MTNNQIQYQRNLETERTNRANELLRRRELSENARHNYQTEGLGRSQLAETIRNNTNMANISWYNAAENARSNKAREQEMARHNTATENITSYYNKGQLVNAQVANEVLRRRNEVQAAFNAGTLRNAANRLAEDTRHNMANEGLQATNNARTWESAEKDRRNRLINTALSNQGKFASTAIQGLSNLALSLLKYSK
uniref:ORF1 n=1 Tax=Macaque picobirnavirus 12 TaxID=2078792 RepID=A0A2L1FE73_9VIRU|nr:ORF1 [Macaque picobirnavirus 12]